MYKNSLVRRLNASFKWYVDRYGRFYNVKDFCDNKALHAAIWLMCNGFDLHHSISEEYLLQMWWLSFDFSSYHSDKLLKFVEDSLTSAQVVHDGDKLGALVHRMKLKAIHCFNSHGSDTSWINPYRFSQLGCNLCDYLNNNLIRVVYNDEDTMFGSLSFRITSTRFDWTDVIYHSVTILSQQFNVRFVSVRRDLEITGDTTEAFSDVTLDDFYFLRTFNGAFISRCSCVDECDAVDPVYPIIYSP